MSVCMVVTGPEDLRPLGIADLPKFDALDSLAAVLSDAGAEIDRLQRRVVELEAAKNAAYAERNALVAWLAQAANTQKWWPVGVAQHPGEDATWEKDWRTIVYMDTSAGQLSWHFHDSESPLLAGLPVYSGRWDGHTTAEKYARLARAQVLPRTAMAAARREGENAGLERAAAHIEEGPPGYAWLSATLSNEEHAFRKAAEAIRALKSQEPKP